MDSRHFIRTIEEITNNALPAVNSQLYDGWLLRLSDSTARRANSVHPLYPSMLPFSEKLAYCEELYRRRDRRLTFKITDAHYPSDLVPQLKLRGYKPTGETSVQIIRINETDTWIAGKDDRYKMTFTNRVTSLWLEEQARWHPPEERNRITKATYDLIIPHAAYFRLQFDGVPVAAGLGIIERGWMGLYSIVVDEEMRGRGIGEELVRRILAYGAAFNAGAAYLQVMTSNTAARKLYARLGFEEVYRYWYLQAER